MYRKMYKSKIHRAQVTEANLNYVGSITIDGKLMEEAGILPNEQVQVVNNNNGERFETYVIEGKRDSGIICLNGAAARLAHPGDVVIIISYGYFTDDQANKLKPKAVMMKKGNKIDKVKVGQ
ncbi:MAG: aspartate 1-decarboxylase [Fusobacteriota bacterium]